MKLTFLGAAGMVTGSCTLLEQGSLKLIVDCGMFQGRDHDLIQTLPCHASEIDAIVLTHSHIDHSGHIPMLVKHGFNGVIYSTSATRRLVELLLFDSAHIQQSEVNWKNKKLIRAGKPPEEPIYNEEDVKQTLRLFSSTEYHTTIEITPDVKLTFYDAGHLLGSSIVRIELTDDNGKRRGLVFSGDLGNDSRPLLCDPDHITSGDCVVMESTYGARVHQGLDNTKEELKNIVKSTFAKGGKVIIPAFAVGRTQELLYHLRELYDEGAFRGYEHCPVFVDSPLAVEATRLFEEYADSYFDEDTRKVLRRGDDPISFDQLTLSVTTEESRRINNYKGSCIIISASGMCDAGRIKHHLKYNLFNPKNSILFAGYQAEGTLGRRLIEGAKKVNIFGETISVKASVKKISGISAHADQPALVKWIDHFSPNPQIVFLNHGDPESTLALAKLVEEKIGVKPLIPSLGDSFTLDFTGEQQVKQAAVIPQQSPIKAEADQALSRLYAVAGKIGYLLETDPNGEHADIRVAAKKIEELWELLKQDKNT